MLAEGYGTFFNNLAFHYDTVNHFSDKLYVQIQKVVIRTVKLVASCMSERFLFQVGKEALLGNKNSELHQEVEYYKKEAAAALARITRARAEIPDAMEAELKQLRESLREARAIAAEEKKRRIALEERFEAIADAATRLLGDMPEEEEEEEEEEGVDQERETGDAERELFRRREGDDHLSDTKEHDHGDGDASRPEHVRAHPSVVIVQRKYDMYDDREDISEEEDEEAQSRGWAGNLWEGLFGSCCRSPGNRDKTLL